MRINCGEAVPGLCRSGDDATARLWRRGKLFGHTEAKLLYDDHRTSRERRVKMLRWSLSLVALGFLSTACTDIQDEQLCDVPKTFDPAEYFAAARLSDGSEFHFRSVVYDCPLQGEVSYEGKAYTYVIYKTGTALLRDNKTIHSYFMCERCGYFDNFFVDGADTSE